MIANHTTMDIRKPKGNKRDSILGSVYKLAMKNDQRPWRRGFVSFVYSGLQTIYKQFIPKLREGNVLIPSGVGTHPWGCVLALPPPRK